MKFGLVFENREALVTAIGDKDFVEFESWDLIDGIRRNYIWIPDTKLLYGRGAGETYKLCALYDLGLVTPQFF